MIWCVFHELCVSVLLGCACVYGWDILVLIFMLLSSPSLMRFWDVVYRELLDELRGMIGFGFEFRVLDLGSYDKGLMRIGVVLPLMVGLA